MDYMKDNREISAEEAVILWQASRLSLYINRKVLKQIT